MENNGHVDEDSKRTVREIVSWTLVNKPHIKSQRESEKILRYFVADYGDVTHRSLRAHMLLSFINSRPSLKSPWTRKRWARVVQSNFNFAVEMGLIQFNPLRLRLAQGPMGRDWADEELRKLLRHSPPYFRRVLVFLKMTGARQGEMRQLQWPHIDFAKRVATLHEHKTAHVTGLPRQLVFAPVAIKLLQWLQRHRDDPGALRVSGRPPKYRYSKETGNAFIRVTMNEQLQQKSLGKYGSEESWRAYQEFLTKWRQAQKTHARANSDYVFINGYGNPWRRAALCAHFRKLRKRAGVASNVKLHGTRHTFCTTAISNGVDVALVMALAGHKNIATTQRYIHMADKGDTLLDAVARAVRGRGAGK